MDSPCETCVHGREGPMDCLRVAAGPYRNLRVVAKVFSAHDNGCAEHVPRPDHRPRWVKDREREQAIMGDPPASGASFGDAVAVALGLAVQIGVWAGIAVVLYLVGRWVVGG